MFIKICLTFFSSPFRDTGTGFWKRIVKSSFFSFARTPRLTYSSQSSSRNRYTLFSITIWFASIFEISRISFTSSIRWCAEVFTIFAYSMTSFCVLFSSIISFMPMTPLIGVLISWLIRARKFDLAWFAISAACSDSWSCLIKLRFSVRSYSTAIYPIVSSYSSWILLISIWQKRLLLWHSASIDFLLPSNSRQSAGTSNVSHSVCLRSSLPGLRRKSIAPLFSTQKRPCSS